MRRNLNVPDHLALIPDGNRRWSRSNKLNLLYGYDMGIKKFVEFSIWLKELGSSTVTVWALSTENIKNRSKRELDVLYKLYIKASYDKSILDKLKKNGARVVVIGNMSKLPKNVVSALGHLQSVTRNNNKFTINILVAYGGREDIIYAAKRMVKDRITKKINQINSKIIRSYMMTSTLSDPDLIIRTSGELRTSGFLPWQSSYSELYFSKKYWPDFDRSDLKKAIMEFSARQRRYGK